METSGRDTSVGQQDVIQTYTAIVEALQDGLIVLDADGNAVELNNAARKMFNIENGADFVAAEEQTLDLYNVDGRMLPTAERPLRRILRGEVLSNVQLVAQRRGDRRRRLLGYSGSRTSRNGVLTSVVTVREQPFRDDDQTALKREKELAEERFAILFEMSPAPTFICSFGELTMLDANDGFFELVGFERGELVGESLYDRAVLPRNGRIMGLVDKIKKAESVDHEEITLRSRDGTTRYVLVTGKQIRPNGEVCIVMTFIDITERRLVERQLEESRLRLAQMQERERLSLARELHDEIIQRLIGISLQIANSKRQIDKQGSVEALRDSLENHQNQIVETAQMLRKMIRGLQPPGLDDFGLSESIRDYIRYLEQNWTEDLPAIKLELDKDPDGFVTEKQWGEHVALCLFRTVQEMLRNALTHAGASQIVVTLHYSDDNQAVLRICDDGVGFEIPENFAQLVRDDHFGLAGVREHVLSLRGNFDVTSARGEGTDIVATVPLRDDYDDDY
ncbi:MAG: PAS domain S-box protein [Trueperaceae bacterium]|nr:PAS domain S-box protein [Trueperaceae bacterium]